MKKKTYMCLSKCLAMVLCVGSTLNVQAFSDENTTSTWTWAKPHIKWAEREGIAEGTGDGRFDADGLVSRAEAVTMLLNYKGIDVTPYDKECEQFEDVGDEWYTKFVNAAVANGIAEGSSETTFEPERELTRAEATTMLVNLMGYELSGEEAENSFEDIAGKWYTSFINTAFYHELVSGKAETIFEPEEYVTRAEMVTMIHNTLNENYEIGEMFQISCSQLNGSYKVTNKEGQHLTFDIEKWGSGQPAYDSNMPEYDVIREVPTGFCVSLSPSDQFVLEVDKSFEIDIAFLGVNSVVDIEGSSIEKIEVAADGIVHLYGENMTYGIKWENAAHTLEFEGSSEKEVVLKVVDKQITEISE